MAQCFLFSCCALCGCDRCSADRILPQSNHACGTRHGDTLARLCQRLRDRAAHTLGARGDRHGFHRGPLHVRRLRVRRRRPASAFRNQFTLVGLFVGAFAIGGLIYSLSVRGLVNRLGQIGLVTAGGVMLALAYLTIALAPNAYLAPSAIMAIGLGYYMMHNTLQTNATQMTPEARGAAVAIFSSALYLGQTLGVATNGIVFDRFGAIPVFVTGAAGLLGLGLWFARALRQRQSEGL